MKLRNMNPNFKKQAYFNAFKVFSLSRIRSSSLTAESRSTAGCDIQQGLWQDAVSLEALDEYVPLPFGKFAAIFVHQKRQMSKGGRLPSKSTVHQEVFGGGDEPLGPPQHMTNLHIMVIDYVSKVIGGISISFYHHRVTFHLRKLKVIKPIYTKQYHNMCSVTAVGTALT